MNNNYIFRDVTQILGFDTAQTVAVFATTSYPQSSDLVEAWGAQKYASNFKKMPDPKMAVFLNGLINTLRGKKEGDEPEPESKLRNNAVFMKLKIAFNLKAEELLEVMELGGEPTNKHDLNALFRKPDNKHYRGCKDETLASFLNGLKLYTVQRSSSD